MVIGGSVALLLFTKVASARSGSGNNADSGEDMGDAVTDPMRDLANAIAHAEGFYVARSIPARAHNPGDLVIQGWTGGTLGDQGIAVFQSDSEGWGRLYRQLGLMSSGRSHVYKPSDTFAQVGAKWTATHSDDWTTNVVEYLQSKGYAIDAGTTLEDFFNL